MCGISGLANFKTSIDTHGYYQAHRKLQHRGKDDEGYISVLEDHVSQYKGDNTVDQYDHLPHIQSINTAQVILGFHRLAIIDTSPDGHQPMHDRTSRYTIVFNGEIYNYVELRDELIELGYTFSTNSDTEVILYAYTHWGFDAFNHFNGMWAIVIYDQISKSLMLSRDRFGVKPLYYLLQDNTFYFSSEIKFLVPFIRKLEVNENRVKEYLVQNLIDHHSETLITGIHQLLPGHYGTFNEEGFSQHTYYTLRISKQIASFDEACDRLKELLLSSIILRLRSDVPVGSLLSGGLDSTTIVCLLKYIFSDNPSKFPFNLFSAVFNEPKYSEKNFIEATVAQTGFDIHWIRPDPSSLIDSLGELIQAQEFPFRSLSVYSQWEVMRQIGETPTKVIFDGQGSDELFGGYTAHYYALIAKYLTDIKLSHAVNNAYSAVKTRQLSLIRALAGTLIEIIKFSPFNRIIRNRSIPYLVNRYHADMDWDYQGDIFENALLRNLTHSALPEYLRYEDRNSMAFTLESRLPFMDYRLIEWAFSIPAEFKITGSSSKRILRETARPFIPDVIYHRTDKMGFISPQEIWQTNELSPAIDRVFKYNLKSRFPFLNDRACKDKYQSYLRKQHKDWAWVWRICCLTWWHQYWFEGTVSV